MTHTNESPGFPGRFTSLHEVLQILSVTIFEQTTLECAMQQHDLHNSGNDSAKQLILFGD